MKLSVIIVNYNVRYYVEQCINSVFRATKGIDTEVFVFDNHSRDNSIEFLRRRFGKRIHLIESNHNLGFARANNKAIQQSTGEYILLLNPDTIVGEDSISQVIDFMESHPNAGGVLVLGLGCENNNINEFKKLFDADPNRVKFMNAQDYDDDFAQGIKLIEELKAYAAQFKREPVPLSMLKVGLKCGGSDGLSGITANPLIGRFSDTLIKLGGTSVLTEVPEMFGAETILMNRPLCF